MKTASGISIRRRVNAYGEKMRILWREDDKRLARKVKVALTIASRSIARVAQIPIGETGVHGCSEGIAMQNPISPRPFVRSRPHNTVSAILRFFGVVIGLLFLIGIAST
jgi:hypothetical protein